MKNPRFIETGRNSFFGKYLYDQIVPPVLFTPIEPEHRVGTLYLQVFQAI